ncbi:MAG: hypothetical protein AAFX10_11925 [Pseudomonadota bacterium]
MSNSTKTLLPALLAVGGGMIGTNASAIELGEINVQSALGQPLRASVAFALQPNEQIDAYCVSLRPTPAGSGLPTVGAARVSVANGVISLTGQRALNEPMATLRLDINCPYTPHLAREYMIFLDPAERRQAASVAPAEVTAPAATSRRRPEPVRTAPRAEVTLPSGERYRVQPGDTLSEIAQRIDNRNVNLWTAVNEIFDANPGAFIDNDPNLMKAGTWITIPDLSSGAQTAVPVAQTPPAESAADASVPDAPLTTYDLLVDAEPSAAPVVIDTTSAAGSAAEPVAPPETAIAPSTFVDPTPVESLEIGDVFIDEPAADAPSEDAAVAGTEGSDQGLRTWGWWFGGALLLIGGLALFGRRRSSSPDKGAPAEARESKPKRYLEESSTVEVIESGEYPIDAQDVDYDLNDDSPTQENLIIDADLEHGTGLDAGVDVDVSEDFSFSSSTELDLELPAEARRSGDDTIEQEITIEHEMPANEQFAADDEYDMSVIVDVTQVRDEDEVTGRDLKAIVVEEVEAVEADAAGRDSDGYTISQEADYALIEQDYEDELSATQALNAEIERAAAELAESMDDVADQVGESMVDAAPELSISLDGSDEADPDMVTAQMATVTPIDATASRSDDEIVSTVVQFDDETAEMPQAADEEDVTTEMPARTGKGR